MIPKVTREKLVEALRSFDAANPTGWSMRGRHRFAIRHEGKLYPVKEIISQATGAPKKNFSGGKGANRYLESRGFEVVELPAPADLSVS